MQFDDTRPTVTEIVRTEISLEQLSDPATPAEELQVAWEILQRLNASETQVLHYRMRLAIAENPNTPVTILNQAAIEHPSSVLRNPVLPLLIMEDPALSCFDSVSLTQLQHVLGETIPLEIRTHIRHIFTERLRRSYRDELLGRYNAQP